MGPAWALEEREKFRKKRTDFFTHFFVFSVSQGPIWARMGPARALEEREKFRKNKLFDFEFFL